MTGAANGGPQKPYEGKVAISAVSVSAYRSATSVAISAIEVDEVYHIGPDGKASGLDPERRTYRSLASFRDPYGNRWLFQEITTRLPWRNDTGVTSFGSARDLENAPRRAAAAHGHHEKRIGEAPSRNFDDARITSNAV